MHGDSGTGASADQEWTDESGSPAHLYESPAGKRILQQAEQDGWTGQL